MHDMFERSTGLRTLSQLTRDYVLSTGAIAAALFAAAYLLQIAYLN